MVKELWYRHLVKTGTWRIVAFIALSIVSYSLTGSIAMATSIVLADWLIKTILYLVHEWAWSKSNIGRKTFSCKKGGLIWFTGLSGSGKTTLADEVARLLEERMVSVKRLDGDVARRTFSRDLGFSDKDRAENCRRAAYVGSYLAEDSIVLASFISPSIQMRNLVRKMGGKIIHVDCSVEECARRDPKGMYAKLINGEFNGVPFTGVHPDAPYIEPKSNDLRVHTDRETVQESAARVIHFLEAQKHI